MLGTYSEGRGFLLLVREVEHPAGAEKSVRVMCYLFVSPAPLPPDPHLVFNQPAFTRFARTT
jgi:hypothetical protein